ncbi:MAG TPA: hypothetical protein VMA09_21840 [Candidatus Binataceae bacterium]|nr:hypothetical protein [Candidatus Binataceae bacterium]
MASRGFFGDLHDALTGDGPYYRRRLNGCEVRILAFTYQPIFAQPPRRVERQTTEETGGMIVLPVNVDPCDEIFMEWFCQSTEQKPVNLNVNSVAAAIGTGEFVLGRWFSGRITKNGCVFDQHSRTIEVRKLNHDAMVQAATSLCRRLSIPCLLFKDYSPKTREFYLVRLLEPDVAAA